MSESEKVTELTEESQVQEAAKTLSKLGASKGGKARALTLSPEARSDIARKASLKRWGNASQTEADSRATNGELRRDSSVLPPEEDMLALPAEHALPEAKYKGVLPLIDIELPCYVLDNGQRVIGRTAATEMLSGVKRQGDLESYLRAQNFQPYIGLEQVKERFVEFRLPEVEALGRAVKGLPADLFIEICQGLVRALEDSQRTSPKTKLTPRQVSIAIKASMFLAACAKLGLDALIDEATGYQYERAEDALQVKLNAYLQDEMRKWEKTFPDELWKEFARLTNWQGSVTQRPKYWGKLVMELVYDYLDPDVSTWLKANAPKPRHGQNYHQWLTDQYGLKKLVEHIWKLIGVASTCHSMSELRDKMALMHGRNSVQIRLFLPPPNQNH